MSDETPKPQGDPAELGDAGKAALAAERKRANDAEKGRSALEAKLKELEDANKSELEKALARVAELEGVNANLAADISAKDLAALRTQVGLAEGLPANLIARLQGSDEDSLKADAASLRELIPDTPASPFPKADPSQGPKGSGGQLSNAQVFADQVGDF